MEDFPPPNRPTDETSPTLLFAPHEPPRPETLWQRIFFGPDGMRAGWRLLLFLAVALTLASIQRTVLKGFLDRHPEMNTFTPWFVLAGEGSGFAIFLAASWIASKIEGRTVADYGLPFRNAFGLRFWQGAAAGFASISALMAALWAGGAFHFGELDLNGAEIWKYGLEWGLAFVGVALFEEFSFRGYLLFTLSTGIGFWPAAATLSLLFGYVHHGNSGESWLGAFAAGLIGLFFCLILRRTGNLWMAIGFHAAWDWGETYFYSVPDSGLVAPGHLFNSTLAGPAWLTGGSVGPEASWLCLLLIVILWCLFSVWLREAKYPNPGTIGVTRKTTYNSLETT
jgi:membrane protease YdiL (CAAX protease family)